jgi:hypothetical protein
MLSMRGGSGRRRQTNSRISARVSAFVRSFDSGVADYQDQKSEIEEDRLSRPIPLRFSRSSGPADNRLAESMHRIREEGNPEGFGMRS